jgi:hypothetical protein
MMCSPIMSGWKTGSYVVAYSTNKKLYNLVGIRRLELSIAGCHFISSTIKINKFY